jgi:hypothetical protein
MRVEEEEEIELEDEQIEDTEEEFVHSKSKLCSDKATCTARGEWCKSVFKDDVPTDCVENFSD